MGKLADKLVDMILRGVVGLVVIYVLRLVCIYQNIPVLAGVNPVTFALTAIFGMPGFLLVFALSIICLL